MTWKKKFTARRSGRHALRSSAAVAALVGVPHDGSTTITRSVLAHTTQEWNALRHAC